MFQKIKGRRKRFCGWVFYGMPGWIFSLSAVSAQKSALPRTPRRSVTLAAVGDILLAGSVSALIKQKGADFPFAKMKAVLQKSDLAFGNLECCVSRRGSPLEKQFTFRADPSLVPVLARTGFDVVSLANNHAWDYGREALEDTVRVVRGSGVKTVGAGADRAEAHRLVIVRKNGLKIGFLAYLGLLPPLIPESETLPCLSVGSEAAIRREVEAARPQVDFLIVSLHAGQENAVQQTPRQTLFARTAIDAGADLVIGHHPHVLQREERYRGKWIFYSLGNFVFSASGRGSGSLLTAAFFSDGTIRAEQTPLNLSGGQPRLMRPPKEHAAIRTRKSPGRILPGPRANSPLRSRR